MSEAFGAMLRRLRQARTMVAPIQPGNPSSRLVERVLSQNELAHRAGVTAGAVHRLENPGKILLELIEVQTGSYFGEDDIIRIEDDYRRD